MKVLRIDHFSKKTAHPITEYLPTGKVKKNQWK